MSDCDRNEILANFQAATGLDDIGIAIAILEQESWDLQRALQSYLDTGSHGGGSGINPVESPNLPICEPTVPMMDQDDIAFNAEEAFRRGPFGPSLASLGRVGPPSSSSSRGGSGAGGGRPQRPRPGGNGASTAATGSRSGSELRSRSGASAAAAASSSSNSTGGASRETRSSKQRLLLFKVQLDDDLLHTVERGLTELNVISKESDTVLEIKRQLHQMMQQPIDIDDMRLRGFPSSVSDSTVLASLRLPKETKLSLASADPLVGERSNVTRGRHQPAEYHLTVRNADRTNCSQVFHYRADDCVGRLRTDVYSLWGIPSATQQWSGWDLNWSSTFGLSNLPSHQDLVVRRNPTSAAAAAASATTPAPDDYADYDFDYDDEHDIQMIEDDEEEMIDATTGRRRPVPPRSVPLIPPGCRSDSQGVRQFVENFAARYGSTCPLFNNASLASAIDEADGQSTADKRPLAIYLHHDRSIAAQIFCSNVLTNAAVIEFLNANFVLWPWDLTQPDNAATLVTLAARQLGLDAADRIRQLAPDDLPALLVVAHRPRAAHEIIGDVQGVSDPSAALDMLVKALDEFRAWREAELAEENAREMRTMERLEMQTAYEESLRLDRQKEEQRAEKQRLEREQQERAEAEQRQALAQLPEEPQAGQPAATIRLRLPGGSETRQRRFNPQDRLRHLAAYCASLGYAESNYNLVTAFPRRTLSQLDMDTTFEAAGLVPQETVLLEEK
uniref:UBX domain-containing protein n=1 Tax=Macrostomum lignano TaxID=282301 RepID=A0A1I8HAS5_9PLAT